MGILFEDINKNLNILKENQANGIKGVRQDPLRKSEELSLLDLANKLHEGKVPDVGSENIEGIIKILTERAIKEEDEEGIEKKENKIYFGSAGENLYYAEIEKAGEGAEGEQAPVVQKITIYDVTDEAINTFENKEGISTAELIYQAVQALNMDSVSFRMLDELDLLKKPDAEEKPSTPEGAIDTEMKPEVAEEPGKEEEEEEAMGKEPEESDARKIESIQEARVDPEMRNKIIQRTTRKPSTWEEAEGDMVEAMDYKGYVEKLPVFDLTGTKPFEEFKEQDKIAGQPFIAKVDNNYFYVDPQGYTYARYTVKLLNFKPKTQEAGLDVKMFEKELPKVEYAGKQYYVDNQAQVIRAVDNPQDEIEFDELDDEILDKVIEIIMAESAKEYIGMDPAQMAKNEAKESKKDLAAAAERTKHALSFLRKIHKAVEAGALETIMDAIEKAGVKGDIDDKQEDRLKSALTRRKEALKANPKAAETEPTKEEEKDVEANEATANEAKYELSKEAKEQGFEIRKATGKVAKDAQMIVPTWMKELEDGKEYRFIVRNTPFGVFWIAVYGEDIEAAEKKIKEAKEEAGYALKLYKDELTDVLASIQDVADKLEDAKKKLGDKGIEAYIVNAQGDFVREFNPQEIEKINNMIGKGVKEAAGQPKTDDERAMTHFNISGDDWGKLDAEKKKEYIGKLPPRGTGRGDADVRAHKVAHGMPGNEAVKIKEAKEKEYNDKLAALLKQLEDKKITQAEYLTKCEELKKEHEAEQEGAPEIKNPKEVVNREKEKIEKE